MTNQELIKLGIVLSQVDGGCGPCASSAAKDCQESFDLSDKEMEALLIGMNNPKSYYKFTWNKETKTIDNE